MRITAAHLRRIIREEAELYLESERRTQRPKGIPESIKGGNRVKVTYNFLPVLGPKFAYASPDLVGVLKHDFDQVDGSNPAIVHFDDGNDKINAYNSILKHLGSEEKISNEDDFKEAIQKVIPKEKHGYISGIIELIEKGIPQWLFMDGRATAVRA